MNRIIFAILPSLLLCMTLKGFMQDIHFSQHYHAQLYTNPSYTGLVPGMSLFSMNTKNQWMSVTKPYQTYLLGFENAFRVSRKGNHFFSAGMLLYYDVAGDSKFSTTQLSPSISYHFLPKKNTNSFISVAFQPGFSQRSLQYNNLNFDSQFDGFIYNPELSTQEALGDYSLFYPDFGMGIHYLSFFDKNVYISGGIALFHFNRPSISMKGASDVRLHQKLIFQVSGGLVNHERKITPSIYYAKQGSHAELLFGARSTINRINTISDNIMFRNNFLLGLYYRGKDALIIYTGAEIKQFTFGLTYDINISQLTPASSARGGIEISASYLWFRNKQQAIKEIPCPIF
jgi:type IX secretion system PorP/SprF family membrane protein